MKSKNHSDSTCFAGQIAEVLIFSRGLTPSERFNLGTYLNWRYNLVANPPATPTNLTAFAVSSDQVALAWSSMLTNVSINFHVQRGTNGGSFADVAVLENATSYLDTGLMAGTEYIYRVMAANYAGMSGCAESGCDDPDRRHGHSTGRVESLAQSRQRARR